MTRIVGLFGMNLVCPKVIQFSSKGEHEIRAGLNILTKWYKYINQMVKLDHQAFRPQSLIRHPDCYSKTYPNALFFRICGYISLLPS
jgi:hypothetical protein